MQEVLVSKIFNYTSTPTKNVEGQFWFNPSTNVLSRFNGTAWKPITVSSDDVAVLTDGNKVSLTSYLNTQIAALAEGIDSKQDKLKFYSEVDKSADTSADSTGSEINLKTSASQYGGSNINLIASNGQYNSGNINLKAKSHNTSGGGNIILESGGGSASGGNITLHSKVNSGGYAEPGGQINIIAESTQTGDGSNISLTAKNIQLKGELSGSGISTYIKGTTPDNESPDITVVDTKVPSEKAVYNAVNTKANKSTTLSGYGITDAYTKTEVDTKLKDYETKEDFDGYTSMVLSTYQQKTDITLETTNKTIVGSINEINENTSKKQDKLSYYSENTTTNKADISIDGKSTGKSEFSINVTDSTGDNSGDSTINLSAGGSAGTVLNGAGKINLEVSGSSGGKISLSAINGVDYSNTGIELNVPFGFIDESYIGENSGIIFNGPISGTGITKTITDVDYKLPTSKAVKTELDKKQDKLSNPGFLYLTGGHAFSECKPTFSSAQSLVFTYKVTEEELDDAPWSIIGNIRVWDSKKGIGIAKQTKTVGNHLQCGFNWGYGQSGDTTSRTFITIPKAQWVDGNTHTYALICGKTDTAGYFKVYQDGILIGLKTISLFDDFTPEYGFSLGKHQTSGSSDNPAKGRMSNIAFFNFDISDSTKTYTIADYHNGKSIPQSLITATEGDRAIWALDNYTKTDSSSKKYIEDLVNYNDAIITNDIHDILDGITSTKQDKLYFYKEDTRQSENFRVSIGDKSVVDYIDLNAEDVISLNAGVSGTAISTSLPTSASASDFKILSEKAVKTELDKKQNNLSLYSEGEVDNAAGWVNIGKDTSKISAGAGDVTLTGAGDVTLTARQNITLDAGSTIEIKNATSISGSVIAGSISSEDTGISGQIPTVGAVATSLNTKQDKLVSYSETTLPPEAGTAGGKTTVDINALSLQITTDTNLGGSAIFKGGSVYVESKLCTNELVVSESITGNAVLSSISSKPVDTKILSEKAIKTELDKKQDTLKTFSENKTDPNTYTVNINASQTCINSKLEVKDTLSTDGNIELGGKIMQDGVDVLATKQDSLKYYSEDTTKAVSKLSSKRLEVNAYNTDGNTYNPLILNDKQGIAIGGNNPSAQDLYAYLNIGDNDGTSLMLSTPVGYSDLRYDGITFKDTNDNLQFGFNNKTYNLLTERAAGLYYLKDTDAKSTGIAIDPDRISLIDYNKYSDDPYISDTSDSHCFFESTKISNGQIQLQTRINGSSEFINEGTISPDCIKLGSGRFGSALDPSADIVITTTQTEDTFAGHFHGIAYDGDTYGDGANNRWYIGTDVDKTGQSSKPIIGKPYIKGFANAEFSETVQATTIQAGKEVSSSSGVATLTEGGLSINTPAGVASFKYDGIEISNAGFKVHGQNGTSTVYPYVQIPDSNGNSFKIWKGTEEQFKALTLVDFDTVYLRIQDNNRIKATVGTDTASLENITDSYTLSSNTFTSFITDTKYNNAQGSILITPSLTNSGALIFGEGVTDTSKGFPLYPDNIVSIPFKNITNFKVAGNLNDSFNYIVSFDI